MKKTKKYQEIITIHKKIPKNNKYKNNKDKKKVMIFLNKLEDLENNQKKINLTNNNNNKNKLNYKNILNKQLSKNLKVPITNSNNNYLS